MNTDYKLLIQQAEALVQGVPHLTANLANISALLYTSLEDINWAGFYLTEGSQLVPDVHAFKGHIACDSASRSEIVIPIHQNGAVVGVLDIDSPSLGRFTEEDLEGLQELVIMLEKKVFH